MFCTRCGHSNPPDARFCAQCGAPMPAAAPADSTSTLSLSGLDSALDVEGEVETEHAEAARAVDALPPDTALLVVKRGPNAGSRFLLDRDTTTAGRHPESDIFLDDVTVSRRHAEFLRDKGTFTVRDVGSLNGTYLNRERIDVAALAGGDEVQIGKFRLVFLTGPSAPAPGGDMS